jgi:hypothetical protein
MCELLHKELDKRLKRLASQRHLLDGVASTYRIHRVYQASLLKGAEEGFHLAQHIGFV